MAAAAAAAAAAADAAIRERMRAAPRRAHAMKSVSLPPPLPLGALAHRSSSQQPVARGANTAPRSLPSVALPSPRSRAQLAAANAAYLSDRSPAGSAASSADTAALNGHRGTSRSSEGASGPATPGLTPRTAAALAMIEARARQLSVPASAASVAVAAVTPMAAATPKGHRTTPTSPPHASTPSRAFATATAAPEAAGHLPTKIGEHTTTDATPGRKTESAADGDDKIARNGHVQKRGDGWEGQRTALLPDLAPASTLKVDGLIVRLFVEDALGHCVCPFRTSSHVCSVPRNIRTWDSVRATSQDSLLEPSPLLTTQHRMLQPG